MGSWSSIVCAVGARVMAHAAAPPPSQPADGNPRLARTIRSYGFAATAAAATGVGGGLPREEPPRPIDYSTTLLVGCGGAHDGDGAKPDGCGSVLVVVVDLLTLGCDVHATLFTAYRGLPTLLMKASITGSHA
jgi:hypothetical protein